MPAMFVRFFILSYLNRVFVVFWSSSPLIYSGFQDSDMITLGRGWLSGGSLILPNGLLEMLHSAEWMLMSVSTRGLLLSVLRTCVHSSDQLHLLSVVTSGIILDARGMRNSSVLCDYSALCDYSMLPHPSHLPAALVVIQNYI